MSRNSPPPPSNSAPTSTTCRRKSSSSREALANTLEIVGGSKTIQPGIFGAAAADLLQDVDAILILACGTSSHSGYTARYWLEAIAGVPCTVEIASEYRYRTSVPNPKQLIVAISQSGETADTLAALRHAKSLGQDKTLAICNVPESAIVRECALRFITRAGPEIGVASTKAFTTQLAALFLLTLVMAKVKQKLDPEQESAYLDQLRHLPVAVNKVLQLEPEIKAWAQRFADKHHALFLGRGRHYPIALEGALKLKEISYIHAEAYPAGELKHGPLALVDSDMPVISIAPNDQLLDKLKSNLKEVQARGGELYVFADQDSELAGVGRRACPAPARALRGAVTDPACGAAAIAVLPCGAGQGDGCGQAEESREISDCGVSMNLNDKKIAIIGLGYVGLPLAVEFGKSRPVVGFDINLARIAELQSGKDSTLEVTSEDLVAAKQLSYSNRLEDIADCGVFIVTVPTPIDKANRPDLTPLVKASETVGKVDEGRRRRDLRIHGLSRLHRGSLRSGSGKAFRPQVQP